MRDKEPPYQAGYNMKKVYIKSNTNDVYQVTQRYLITEVSSFFLDVTFVTT